MALDALMTVLPCGWHRSYSKSNNELIDKAIILFDIFDNTLNKSKLISNIANPFNKAYI